MLTLMLLLFKGENQKSSLIMAKAWKILHYPNKTVHTFKILEATIKKNKTKRRICLMIF